MISFGKRFSYAFRSFFKILSSGELPPDIAEELAGPSTGPPPQIDKPADSTDRAVQILAILQRDGRLIDFFTEDISPYSDAQIGAAVRDLHQSCKQTLERYVKLEPIIESEEGLRVTVQDPFDPASVKLIGNATGKPPLSGLLRHRGWRVSKVNLPPLPEGAGRSVIAPAEVEVS
ncbi:MAG TPA: DUF2760 domain-containing protein [Blastocatellia bacterium]|nr:DUF2760 domain-containing protein [Blastocatellia bacterium]